MPLVNIYFWGDGNKIISKEFLVDVKKYLAEKLSCSDITLSFSEISIRLLNIAGGDMIANMECEITAHAFHERVEKQDKICLDVMNYIKEKTGIEHVKVWLKLCELGHSW